MAAANTDVGIASDGVRAARAQDKYFAWTGHFVGPLHRGRDLKRCEPHSSPLTLCVIAFAEWKIQFASNC
jgi:hypothetical protein